MSMTTCPHCHTRVLPKSDGTCPSCTKMIRSHRSVDATDVRAGRREYADQEDATAMEEQESESAEAGGITRFFRDPMGVLLILVLGGIASIFLCGPLVNGLGGEGAQGFGWVLGIALLILMGILFIYVRTFAMIGLLRLGDLIWDSIGGWAFLLPLVFVAGAVLFAMGAEGGRTWVIVCIVLAAATFLFLVVTGTSRSESLRRRPEEPVPGMHEKQQRGEDEYEVSRTSAKRKDGKRRSKRNRQ